MRWPDPVDAIPGSGALRELSRVFAATADAHDRDGTFPFANYRALHDLGYLGRSIPQAFGGPGEIGRAHV